MSPEVEASAGVDHCGFSARTPLNAAQVLSAITATALSSLTTLVTPGMARAGASSTETSLAP